MLIHQAVMKTRGCPSLCLLVVSGLFLASSSRSWAQQPPVNDNFANRITLSGAPVSGNSTTVGATREAFEPNPGNFSATVETVWWTWTAPAAGKVTINTTGSDINPEYVCVYNGASIDQLHTVAANSIDNQGSQTITFDTIAGAVYQISVGNGSGDGAGAVFLNIRLNASNIAASVVIGTSADANDNFANRITLAGASVAGIGYNFDATRESLETQGSGDRTLWWTWTAPADGILTVDSSATDFDNIVVAFSGNALGSLDVLGSSNGSPDSFSIPVTAGVDYQFSIGSNFDEAGTAVLDLNFFQPSPFFNGETPLSNGVYYLQLSNGNFFGYYSYLTDPHYIFHFDLGYEYVFDANDGKDGVYLYDFYSDDFFYSSPVFPFPYLYDFGLQSVLYYYPDLNHAGHYDTNGYRFFYEFKTGQIISK